MTIRSLIFLTLINLHLNPCLAQVPFRWVGYSPSYPWQPNVIADSVLVCRDLETLRDYGFRGLVTYGTLDSLCRVPRYAKALGFDSVIMGIWIDTNTTVNQLGITWALRSHGPADKLCVGNEALFLGRCSLDYLQRVMDTIRLVTGKPVTTAEHWTMYHHPRYRDWLLQNCDLLFPICNPTDNGIFDPNAGAHWVKARFDSIALLAGDSLPVLVKEAGWPTHSDSIPQRSWANESCQTIFFSLLDSIRDTSRFRFCHFEAYDGYWKRWDSTQRYWGLFDSLRNPKRYVRELMVAEPESERHSWGHSNSATMVMANRLALPDRLAGGLFDSCGRLVLELHPGPNDVSRVAPGVYFVRAPSAVSVRKVLVTR